MCHPYLCLQCCDILNDINIRGFVVGATNIMFRQKRHLVDAIVEVCGRFYPFSLPFPYLGSAHRVFDLHVLPSCGSSIFTPFPFMSFLITSLHLSFCLPIFQCPPTSMFLVLHLLQSSDFTLPLMCYVVITLYRCLKAAPHGAIDSQENTRVPRKRVYRIMWQAIRANSSVSETGQSYDPGIITCST